MSAFRLRETLCALSVSTVMLISEPAVAATLILGASTQAWYSEFGANSAVLENQDGPVYNTFTGSNNSIEFRSYFVFDTSTIEEPVVSGSLQLYQKRYYSSVTNEAITLYDVTTPTDELVGGLEVSTFEDLGSGEVYGTADINAQPPENDFNALVEEYFEVVLTEAAIEGINLARQNSQNFAIGISLSSIDNTPYAFTTQNWFTEGILFSGGVTDPLQDTEFPGQLILTTAPVNPPTAIPESSSLLGLLSLSGLAALWRLKRSQ